MNSSNIRHRALPNLQILTFLLVAIISVSQTLAQTPEQQQPPAEESAEKTITMTDVPKLADETHLSLNKIRSQLEPRAEITAIESELPQALDSLEALHTDSLYSQLGSLSSRTLQILKQEWTFYLSRLEEWEGLLLNRSQSLEAQKALTEKMAADWQSIRENMNTDEAPQEILERVDAIVVEVDTVRENLLKRINELLVMQNQISEYEIAIKDLISQFNSTAAALETLLFVRDSPPLWDVFRADADSLNLAKQFTDSWGGFFRTLDAFVVANENRFFLHIAIFVILLLIMFYFYRRNRQQRLFDEGEEVLQASAFFLSRPVSAALLIALFFSVWLYPESSVTVGELLVLIMLIPVLRLMSGIIAPDRHKAVYILAVLYFGVVFHNNAVGYVFLQRMLVLLITMTAIGLIIWLIKTISPERKKTLTAWPKLVANLYPIALLALLVSFTANIFGSMSLARVLLEGVIKSIVVAVVLYSIAIVLDGLMVLLIRKRGSQGLTFVKTYAEKMERWVIFFIHLVAFLIWIRATLKAFRLYDPLNKAFNELLEIQWTFGAVTVSVQNIFDFLLTIVLTLLLSRIIRIFLDLEVFSRVRLPRGIPGAISMVVRYTIVGVGVFLAISSLGIDLGSFGILAGALGVGLGFGLQNIIANFVSGLILAFERPIQVGDKVEVGAVLGNVKQIGVRSSTVKTFDGSEVIVPNADLISNQVTNWTLSDARQRIKLPVKVAFENDPEQVLEILHTVASEHQGVLHDPEPVAVFNGFGDYFLDFTLYYWVSGNIFQTKTEVALGVHRKIKEKGIDIPRPQQDLNLRMLEGEKTKQPPAED